MRQDPAAKLVIRREDGSEEELSLQKEVITIGRRRDCDIVVRNPYVSRHHATIRREGERFIVKDESSRAGTYVQGTRLKQPKLLAHGDRIRIETLTITFLDPTATAEHRSDEADYAAAPVRKKLVVHPDTRQVTIGGRRLESRLSTQEFDLLSYLYINYGRACSREELGDEIWGAGKYDFGMLHQLVYRLRQKIEPSPSEPRYILSTPGYGYRLILEPQNH